MAGNHASSDGSARVAQLDPARWLRLDRVRGGLGLASASEEEGEREEWKTMGEHDERRFITGCGSYGNGS